MSIATTLHTPKARSGHEVPHTPQPVLDPCPCDECPTAAKCAAHRTCCMAFERFVDGQEWQGVTRHPSKTLYMRMYDEAPADTRGERDNIENALAASRGNMSKAAELLGVVYHTFRRRVNGLGLGRKGEVA